MELEEKLRTIRNERGVTLYDHLMNVLGKILLEKNPDPYGNFEQLSHSLKSEDVYLGYSDKIKGLIRENGADITQETKRIRAFFKLDPPPVDPEKEDETPPKEEEELPTNVLSNVVAQERITRKCGVSIGESEAFFVLNALKQFSASRAAVKCSFWGKIIGHNINYYVIECPAGEKIDKPEGSEEPLPVDEPAGTGVNSKTYFVCTDLLANDWVELPPVSARQIRQARNLKYTFTGNLKKRIISSPEFEGEERHYVSSSAQSTDCQN